MTLSLSHCRAMLQHMQVWHPQRTAAETKQVSRSVGRFQDAGGEGRGPARGRVTLWAADCPPIKLMPTHSHTLTAPPLTRVCQPQVALAVGAEDFAIDRALHLHGEIAQAKLPQLDLDGAHLVVGG